MSLWSPFLDSQAPWEPTIETNPSWLKGTDWGIHIIPEQFKNIILFLQTLKNNNNPQSKAIPSEMQVFPFYFSPIGQNISTNSPIFPSDQELFKGRKYTPHVLHTPFTVKTAWDPHLCSNTTPYPLLPLYLHEGSLPTKGHLPSPAQATSSFSPSCFTALSPIFSCSVTDCVFLLASLIPGSLTFHLRRFAYPMPKEPEVAFFQEGNTLYFNPFLCPPLPLTQCLAH